jgi:hypothetical protein
MWTPHARALSDLSPGICPGAHDAAFDLKMQQPHHQSINSNGGAHMMCQARVGFDDGHTQPNHY